MKFKETQVVVALITTTAGHEQGDEGNHFCHSARDAPYGTWHSSRARDNARGSTRLRLLAGLAILLWAMVMDRIAPGYYRRQQGVERA